MKSLRDFAVNGNTISHYQVTGKLGEGGMGIVYKARDIHLNRSVAIKVLPGGDVADADRKRRFVQEAKAASALNHPNIVTIYDIDNDDGTDFIAMEYVPGKTLDELIPRKGMQLSVALNGAVQIADALAKAHAAGIIHGDLKPSNIMVNDDGLVKILDFGVARLSGPIQVDGYSSTAKEKVREEVSGKSGIPGTLAYMSPERVESGISDVRSEIFSFGSVLYEMITGRPAFRRNTMLSTAEAVLNEEPVLLSSITGELRRIVSRCLRKDPGRRFQDMADLKVALQELKEELDGIILEASDEVARHKRVWWPLTIASLLVCLTGLFLIMWQHRNKPPVNPEVLPLTYFVGNEQYPSISPDGMHVAFSWDGEKEENDDIYVKLVNSEKALRLTTNPMPDVSPTWSPDGSQIAFIRLHENQSAVFLITPLGGAERKLADLHFVDSSANRLRSFMPSLSWSPDGEWLAAVEADPASANGVFLVPSRGGEKRKLISDSIENIRFIDPAFSPDGRSLAYAACTGERSCDVYVQDLDPGCLPRGSVRPVTKKAGIVNGIAWIRDGRSILYAASDITGTSRMWRVAASGNVPPQPLLWAGDKVSYPTLSKANNRLVYARNASRDLDIWKFQVGTTPAPFALSTLPEFDPQFSPDGERLAFSANRTGRGSELWVADSDGTNPVPLTEGNGRGLLQARWSPDSHWIIYNAQQEDGRWDVFRIDAAGGRPQNLTPGPADNNLPSYSRDGKWIYFSSNRTGRYEIWRMPATGGEARQVTDKGGAEGLESWDGQTLYYVKDWSRGIFARPVAGGAERLVLESVELPMASFVVVDNGIYYVCHTGPGGSGPLEFRFFSFIAATSQTLMQFNARGGQGLTLSCDRKSMLYTVETGGNSDLMLVENFQ